MHEQAILIRLLDFNMSKKFKIGYSKSIEGDKLIGALATNTSVDRDGDIMETSGIDLGNFMKNPVMLWAHDHMSLPIGRIINTRKTAEGLVFDAIEPGKEKSEIPFKAGDKINLRVVNVIKNERRLSLSAKLEADSKEVKVEKVKKVTKSEPEIQQKKEQKKTAPKSMLALELEKLTKKSE